MHDFGDNIHYTKIKTVHGDIIGIDSNGFLSLSEFEDKDDFKYTSWLKYSYDNLDDGYYTQHEQLLFDICNTFGIDEDDVAILLDCDLFHSTIQSIITVTTL